MKSYADIITENESSSVNSNHLKCNDLSFTPRHSRNAIATDHCQFDYNLELPAWYVEEMPNEIVKLRETDEEKRTELFNNFEDEDKKCLRDGFLKRKLFQTEQNSYDFLETTFFSNENIIKSQCQDKQKGKPMILDQLKIKVEDYKMQSTTTDILPLNEEVDKPKVEPRKSKERIKKKYKRKNARLLFKPKSMLFYLNKESAKSNVEINANPCSCKQTKCIKLYCDCFSNKKFCSSKCGCVGCFNIPLYSDIRDKAIDYLEKTNKGAFTSKLKSEGSTKQHVKGCKCKNSFCLKNYCECFQIGVECSESCGCTNCQNTITLQGKKEQKRRKNKFVYTSKISKK